ncbi:unnamed protein product [Cyclocybe aegerita]|uniref:F-box domain-containing protein n=1 Tax=Cyclocybe aegerita TaxID=1973307 RepID=A0A8S0VTB3_CYCAE|nr:unnamed protein product [Cyclocybe aegerita]
MSVKEPPLIFTLVCRRWHQLALSTPSLWASFYVPVPPPSYSYGYQEEQASEKLALTTTVKRLLSTIFLLSKRWERLEITAPVPQVQRVVSLPPSEAPSLKSLTISTRLWQDDESDIQAVFHNPQLFMSTSLRHLTLREFPGNVRVIPISWSTLSHVSISESYTSRAHSIDDIAWILRAYDQPLRHAYHLTPLFTAYHPPQITGDAPAAGLPLDVPSLQEVTYYFARTLPKPSPLLFWVETSSNHLRTLETSRGLFPQDDFLACLHLCPNLEALKLDTGIGPILVPQPAWELDDAFFRRFTTPDQSGRILCPKMKKLRFGSQQGFGGPTDKGLLDFICAKQDGNVPGVTKLTILDIYLSR